MKMKDRVKRQVRPRFRKKSCPICGRQVSFAHGGNYYKHLDACEVRHEKVKHLRNPCCNSIPISQDGRKWFCRKCKVTLTGAILDKVKEMIKK